MRHAAPPWSVKELVAGALRAKKLLYSVLIGGPTQRRELSHRGTAGCYEKPFQSDEPPLSSDLAEVRSEEITRCT